MHKQKKLFNNIHYDKFILLFNQSRCYLFDKHQLLQLLSVNSRISSKSWPHIIILLYASYMQASSILLTARGHINGVDGTGTGTYISTVERDLFNFVINSQLIISTRGKWAVDKKFDDPYKTNYLPRFASQRKLISLLSFRDNILIIFFTHLSINQINFNQKLCIKPSYFIMKAKKNTITVDHQTTHLFGLFSSKYARERTLQQLKRGTLFRNSHKSNLETSLLQSNHHSNQCWLNDIELDIEQCPLKQKQQQNRTVKLKKYLPRIRLIKTKKQLSISINERRCDKITCLQKKLAKIGAWSNENRNNMKQSITKLEEGLSLKPNALTTDDFERMDKSPFQNIPLQNSLDFKAASSIFNKTVDFNPFKNAALYSSLTSAQPKNVYFANLPISKKKAYQLGVDHYIPPFLMKSLILENMDEK